MEIVIIFFFALFGTIITYINFRLFDEFEVLRNGLLNSTSLPLDPMSLTLSNRRHPMSELEFLMKDFL